MKIGDKVFANVEWLNSEEAKLYPDSLRLFAGVEYEILSFEERPDRLSVRVKGKIRASNNLLGWWVNSKALMLQTQEGFEKP